MPLPIALPTLPIPLTGRVFHSARARVCEVKGDFITPYKMFEDTPALQDAFA